jgi:hypothetical protein
VGPFGSAVAHPRQHSTLDGTKYQPFGRSANFSRVFAEGHLPLPAVRSCDSVATGCEEAGARSGGAAEVAVDEGRTVEFGAVEFGAAEIGAAEIGAEDGVELQAASPNRMAVTGRSRP